MDRLQEKVAEQLELQNLVPSSAIINTFFPPSHSSIHVYLIQSP